MAIVDEQDAIIRSLKDEGERVGKEQVAKNMLAEGRDTAP